MDYKTMARDILAKLGGEDNVASAGHCATRLRITLRDDSIVNDSEIEAIDGVVNVVNKAGQYQILIGTEVPKLYDEFDELIGGGTNDAVSNKDASSGSIVSNIFGTISSIFAPLLPALAGSGILRGLLLLAVQFGWISEASGTYTILNSAAMTVFYFLPILLAVSAGRRFGASPYISALIGGALLHPDIMGLMGNEGMGATTEVFGIPVVLIDYSSSVVPILLSIWAFSYLYKFLDRTIPETLKLVVIPLISLLVMVPLTLVVIGPLGYYGGELIGSFVNWLIESSSILAGIFVGGGWSVLVSLGVHWAVNPIMINNISTVGFDYIVPFTFACNFAVIGTTLGAFLKAKDKEFRNFAMTGAVTISLSAIIEPTMFGLLVKNRKLWIAQIIGGAVGGAYLGLMNVVTSAFVFGSVTTFPAFVTENSSNFMHAMIGLLISTVLSGVIAYFVTRPTEELA